MATETIPNEAMSKGTVSIGTVSTWTQSAGPQSNRTGPDSTPRADPVTENDLERRLGELATEIEDPRAGLFGPSSQLWQVNRHAALFLGGGRAALLQLAHPAVAQAIVDHSDVQSDPFLRFRRTFAQVFAMVYGDLPAALDSARRVGRIHRAIRGRFPTTVGPYRPGDEYSASDPEALLWVHSTLWETSVSVYEQLVGPLAHDSKETYYRETRRFADLFGIDRAMLPPDWSSFLRYNEEMWASDRLTVGAAGLQIAKSLFRPRPQMPWPMAPWYRTLTAGLLPPRLRHDFELSFGPSRRTFFGLSMAVLRNSHRFWPLRIRYVPAYLEAMRRLSGDNGRDRMGEWLSRLYVGRHPR